MGSIFGIDITGDGKADMLDDMIMMNILEQANQPEEDDEEDDDD